MSGKQHKRELKRARQAQREAVRRAERRRSLITGAIVGMIMLIGGGLVAWTLYQERAAEAAQQQAAEAAASEAAAQASEEARRVAEREVACGATAPPAAGEEKPTFSEPEQVLEDGVDYRAVIETSCGAVEIDLTEGRAPETVNSFVFLAQQDFFDGLEIFRNATTIGALQTGSGTNDPGFDIGYTLPDELELAEEEGYPPGAVATANAGPGTGGSQFFFVYNDAFDELFAENRTYTRFGTVIEGLDVLEEIGAIPTISDSGPNAETPSELVYIEDVRMIEQPGE